MKKLFLFIPFILAYTLAKSQNNLDTSIVRNITFKSGDLDYMTSYYIGSTDSIEMKYLRFIRLKSAGKQNSDNVTLDSIPGGMLVRWYTIIRQVHAGEADALGGNPKNVLQAITHPIVASRIAAVEAAYSVTYLARRRLGRLMNKEGQ